MKNLHSPSSKEFSKIKRKFGQNFFSEVFVKFHSSSIFLNKKTDFHFQLLTRFFASFENPHNKAIFEEDFYFNVIYKHQKKVSLSKTRISKDKTTSNF